MNRSAPLLRKTPMKRGTKPLRSSTPMPRATDRELQQKSVKKATPKLKPPAKKKREQRNEGPDYAGMCRGRECYLRLPDIHQHDAETVVPCHSNSSLRGKGMALKALDVYTVPGCSECHRELDQGNLYTKAEKFAFWERAYVRWEIDRRALIGKS